MKKVGILLCDTVNPFWQAKIAQYRHLAPSFGFDIAFRVADNSDDPDEQCRELRRMTQESYDAVIINPMTGNNLLPALSSLPFPTFDVGPKCDPEKTAGIRDYVPVPVTDFEEQGFLAGDALLSASNYIAQGWGLILGGFCDARQSVLRCRGAFKAFRRVLAQENIVTVYANFNSEDAFRAVKELAPKLDIRVIFCANDLMALGAAGALRENFAGASIPIGGVDAIPEALEALKDGRMFCTVSLCQEDVVRGVYRVISDWFAGIPPSKENIARSVLVRRG